MSRGTWILVLGAATVLAGPRAAQAATGAVQSSEAHGPPAAADAAVEVPSEVLSEVLPPWTAEERAAIELLRGLRRRERPADEELVARLDEAGERLIPLFFDCLASRSVPGLDGARAQTLSEVQEGIVLLALRERDRNAVLALVGAVLAQHTEARYRAAALDCIGAVARANDLPQLFELTLAPEEHDLDERLARCLRRAVKTMIGRDPRAFEQLVTLRRITRPELLPTLVGAVGDARDPRGLRYLSEVVYWDEGLVGDVMSQVAVLGPSGDENVDAAMRVRLRTYLDEERPGECRGAIVALTALQDEDAIAPLIELLGCEDQGVLGTAHWALKQLTGLSLSPSPEVWARWHQAELYWMVRSKTREFRRMKETDPAAVADAMREVLRHPLARKELRAALPDLLMNHHPAIRVLTCRTLAEIEAGASVPRLVWALEDPAVEVAEAAHHALRALTGLDLPRDVGAWEEATGTQPRDAQP